ncbi:MAG: exo-alpha-sialidase [Bacteroidales bacterium]|nr:exo-alpha-sialidase [Bacteroidales bacterium]
MTKNFIPIKSIIAIILTLIALPGISQDKTEKFGNDHQVYIKAGEPIAVHNIDFTEIPTIGETVKTNEKTGDLFANSIIQQGAFYLYARLKIEKVGGTAASFQLGKNYFGFDGRQTDIYLNGKLFGDEVISLKPNKDFIKSDTWFVFEIIRKDSVIRFMIDNKEVYSVVSKVGFTGEMGFHPIRAQIEVSDFYAKGTLMPVSLKAPGFSIPIIDLSFEKERQVVIDKEEGQYLGHPTTVLLEDGKTMYIVYPKGHGGGQVVMKKSKDRGHTWSKRLKVPESWAGSKEVPTLYPAVDKKGKKRIIMFSGLNPIKLSVSENNGKSWSELEPIFHFGGIVAMSDMIRLNNGDYVAFFHDDGRFIAGERKRRPNFIV